MFVTDTVVVGGGQAGLAASYFLAADGHHHVVLERGRIGQRWRSGVWDSLRLLSPNWMNSLPGWAYQGAEPDGFSPAADFSDSLARYAGSFHAPVVEGAEVQDLRMTRGIFEVITAVGAWRARSVILATGWCDLPRVPSWARDLHRSISQVTPTEYRNAAALPAGGVLVVGASATGLQLAHELRAAGRDVTLAVGRHRRMPRTYRGRDIYWWLLRLGLLDTSIESVRDARGAPFEPSYQVVGRPDFRTVDLATLQADGVRLVGRVTGADGHRIRLSTDLSDSITLADRRLARLLSDIDAHIDAAGLGDDLPPAAPRAPVADSRHEESLHAQRDNIGVVLWATGHRRSYPWLSVPVLDERGEIRQHHGRTPVPGLYVLGQRFQHYRSSNWIWGTGRDAAEVCAPILGAHRAARRSRRYQGLPDVHCA
jgi:putative flavoprotein involved in K+ transport